MDLIAQLAQKIILIEKKVFSEEEFLAFFDKPHSSN